MSKQRRELIPETVTESKESFGFHWELKSRMNTRPPIEIWWEDQRLMIRQETRQSKRMIAEHGCAVDILTLEVGMAYDLLKVITRALDVGPE
jgi:hypothetical protein